MSNYIFLTKNFTDDKPLIYSAISEDRIETLNVSDCYADYGQRISNSDAGDSLELLSERAVLIANGESDEDDVNGHKIGDSIYAYDDSATFDLILEDKLLKEGEDYSLNCDTCEGFTFWDGHNWQTITTSANNGEPSHSIVDDEELIKELNAAIENKEFEKEGFGRKIYTHDGWVVIDSYCQGEWAAYDIISSSEYEMNQANY